MHFSTISSEFLPQISTAAPYGTENFTDVTEVVDLLDSIGHCWTTLVEIGRKWILSQCLFGEHLLLDKVNANVALVNSENTAVICFLLMPEYV